MTIHEIYQAAAAIEGMAQDLYERLAQRYSAEPLLHDLFADLAREEAQHALRIRLLGRQAAQDPARFRVDAHAEADVAALAVEFAAMADEFAANDYHGDLVDLLDRVSEMERRLAVLHADQLARDADAETRALFQSMADQDSRHYSILESAARSWNPGAR